MDGSLSIDAIVVWHVLSIYADAHTHLAWPSSRTIQLVAKMGRHRVNQAVKELIRVKAVSRELRPRKDKRAIYGSTAYFTVTPLHKWVTKKHVLENPECTKTGHPETGHPEIGYEHIPPLEQLPTREQKLNTSPQLPLGQPLSLTLPETEALLADWGIDVSVANMVLDKMEARNWTDRSGLRFPTRENLVSFVAGLANKINADRTGEAHEKLKIEKASLAPVATHSQEAEWQEPDNDGEYM